MTTNHLAALGIVLLTGCSSSSHPPLADAGPGLGTGAPLPPRSGGTDAGSIALDGGALPGAAPAVCSLSSTEHSMLTIVNNSSAVVEAWWVDFKCTEVLYGTANAGGGMFLNDTFVTHPWRIRAATTELLLKEIPPAPDATPRTITYP